MNFNEKIAWDEAISDRKQMEISGLKSNPAEGNPDVLVGSMFSISQQCPLATKTKKKQKQTNKQKQNNKKKNHIFEQIEDSIIQLVERGDYHTCVLY